MKNNHKLIIYYGLQKFFYAFILEAPYILKFSLHYVSLILYLLILSLSRKTKPIFTKTIMLFVHKKNTTLRIGQILTSIWIVGITGCNAYKKSSIQTNFAKPKIEATWENKEETAFKVTLHSDKEKQVSLNHKIQVTIKNENANTPKAKITENTTSNAISSEKPWKQYLWKVLNKKEGAHLEAGSATQNINFAVAANKAPFDIFIVLVNKKGQTIQGTEKTLKYEAIAARQFLQEGNKLIEQAAAIADTDGTAHAKRAKLYCQGAEKFNEAGESNKANDNYKKAGNAFIYAALETTVSDEKARLYEKAGDAWNKAKAYKEAADSFKNAAYEATASDEKTRLYEKAGDTWNKAKENKEAGDCFVHAAKNATNLDEKARLYEKAGDVYNKAQEYKEAVIAFKNAAKNATDTYKKARFVEQAEDAWNKAEHHEKATFCFAYAADPTTTDTYAKAWLYEQAGDAYNIAQEDLEAVRSFENAAYYVTDPNAKARFLEQAGDVWNKAQEDQAAARYFENAANFATDLNAKARLYEKAGDAYNIVQDYNSANRAYKDAKKNAATQEEKTRLSQKAAQNLNA